MKKEEVSMKHGTIFYDSGIERFDIHYGNNETFGGLHCGDCFEVYHNSEWKSTRIEYNHDRNTANKGWYLIKLPGVSLGGLQARID